MYLQRNALMVSGTYRASVAASRTRSGQTELHALAHRQRLGCVNADQFIEVQMKVVKSLVSQVNSFQSHAAKSVSDRFEKMRCVKEKAQVYVTRVFSQRQAGALEGRANARQAGRYQEKLMKQFQVGRYGAELNADTIEKMMDRHGA
jgi:ABC-type phosphate transport system auxiliary subunit